MKKLKVLFLLASSNFSGAENVVCTIIENIRNDIECFYCCPNGNIREQLEERKIKYIPLKRLSYFELKKYIKKYKPDIIHAHDYRASFLATLFCKKCKIISHIHVNNPTMTKRNIKSYMYRVLARRYKKIIWVSDSALDNYYYKKNILNKSIVLYNVINSKEIERKANIDKCRKNYDLIFIGRLSEQKDPERLIEIIRLLKEKKENIKLAILGEGEKRLLIEDKIFKSSLQDNIDLYGFINNPFPILKNSKLLIITSRWEGTPMVAIEAQALNKPIISTPVDGMKKIIKNDFNGFISDNNNEIAYKILQYLDDSQYEILARNVKNNFVYINNSDEYFKKLKKIYI